MPLEFTTFDTGFIQRKYRESWGTEEYMYINAFLYSVAFFFPTEGKELCNASGFEFPLWFVNIRYIFVAPDGFLRLHRSIFAFSVALGWHVLQ